MDKLKIRNIDHLGIITGIVDQMGLVEIINQEIGENSQEKISAGIVVKAMILNGLGFVNAPLYLFSKFFEEKALEHLLGETSWLSRVPSTLNEALSLKQELNEAAFKDSEREGYRMAGLCSWYGGIPQRWLVVESAERKESELKKLDKKIEKAFQNAEKGLEKFKKIDFACEADALLTAERWNQELPFHSLTDLTVVAHPYFNQSGRPKKGAVPDGYHYRLSAQLALQREKVDLARLHAGRFILATNVLESKTLTDEQILSEYKAQQSTERGFRFLKDPLFFASSVFLKTPRRIAALAMVMALSLLVYTLAQRTLRQSLAQQGQTVPHQLGKPTATPTMRWIFQCFQSIYSVFLDDIHHISNLTPEHQHILSFLGSSCQKYYLLC